MTNDQKLAMIQLFGIKAAYYTEAMLYYHGRQLQRSSYPKDSKEWVRLDKGSPHHLIGFGPIHWEQWPKALTALTREDLEWLVHDE